ncbi:MAG: hypothetical protein ABIP97_02455 [Chthoniobacterales bacterium]
MNQFTECYVCGDDEYTVIFATPLQNFYICLPCLPHFSAAHTLCRHMEDMHDAF